MTARRYPLSVYREYKSNEPRRSSTQASHYREQPECIPTLASQICAHGCLEPIREAPKPLPSATLARSDSL